MIFNLIYTPDEERICYAKRFRIQKFVLEKIYLLFPPHKKAKILYFNQGKGVVIEYQFVPNERLRKTRDIFIFDEILVKG